MDLLEKRIECPYCGEGIEVLIDATDAGDSYVEDCQVCCRPIVFKVNEESGGETRVFVQAENE